MNCNIVINQQPSLPTSERSARETKTKDQKSVEAALRGRENYMKKVKEKLLKDNQKTQMTLKEFIDYFQQDLNDPASTLTAIEETMRLMIEEHNTEINISIRMIEILQHLTPFDSLKITTSYMIQEPKSTRIFILYI